MSTPVIIEPVPPAAQKRGLEFLLGGTHSDFLIVSRAEALQRHLRDRKRTGTLWWARVGRRCVAAAMTIACPGRTGVLLHTPADAPGVNAEVLVAVVQAAARENLSQGATLVQVMISEDRDVDVAVVRQAGFETLALLAYMRQSPPRPAVEPPNDLWWRCGEEFNAAELGRVITATYEGSLDCPRLAGVRRVEDVIASHKATGVYRPASWWIAAIREEAVGCVLMNDSTTERFAEIVYLGVVPHFRGQGLGRRLLHHAAADAHARHLEGIDLAVDDRNVYAKHLYEAEGYRATRRRWAYVMFA